MTFIRYLIIQIIAYGIDMGVFLAFVYLGYLGPIASNAIGKVAAGIFAFLSHRSFTFRLEKDMHSGKQKYRYFLLLGLNVPISSIVLAIVLMVIDYPVFAKIISDVVIVVFSYWMSKTWVFVPDIPTNSSNTRQRDLL